MNIYKTKNSYFIEDDKNPSKEIYVVSKYDEYYFGGKENDIEIEELISAEDYVKIEELYMRYGKEDRFSL